MGIFVLILKIIGILLAVCILLLGAALTVPVRYRAHAQAQQNKAEFEAVFHWLFHLIDCRISYAGKSFACKLRIFGFSIGAGKEKKRKRKRKKRSKGYSRKKRKKGKGTETAGPNEAQEAPNDSGFGETQTPPIEIVPEEPEPSKPGEAMQAQGDKAPGKSGGEGTKERQKGNNSKQNGKNKKKRRTRPREKKPPIFKRIRMFLGNLKERAVSLLAKGETVKEKTRSMKELLMEESNRLVFAKVCKELRFLLRHIAPRKAHGELVFGMADPAQTGQVLGALSLLPFWAKYRINICPDFQSERFFVEGKLWVKGHIRLWHFLLSAIRLLKDKNVRLLIGKLR